MVLAHALGQGESAFGQGELPVDSASACCAYFSLLVVLSPLCLFLRSRLFELCHMIGIEPAWPLIEGSCDLLISVVSSRCLYL